MTCRGCGASIADKAIVCYRCGQPVAAAAGAAARASAKRPWRRWIAIALAIATVIASYIWLRAPAW